MAYKKTVSTSFQTVSTSFQTVSTSFYKYQSDDYRHDELIRIIEHSARETDFDRLNKYFTILNMPVVSSDKT